MLHQNNRIPSNYVQQIADTCLKIHSSNQRQQLHSSLTINLYYKQQFLTSEQILLDFVLLARNQFVSLYVTNTRSTHMAKAPAFMACRFACGDELQADKD